MTEIECRPTALLLCRPKIFLKTKQRSYVKGGNLRSKNLTIEGNNDDYNKKQKSELMLTKRVKAYSSSCSQTVSLSPVILSQFILGLCFAAEDRKNQ